MTDFQRNNLDSASSPYLQQHKNHPINWQEWSAKALDYAKKENKMIFVSIGYSTCHWCHVMANDTFSDVEIAQYLNRHFVSIKVDREQRPDIDQHFMEFLTETTGQGGWPLNVFLNPDGKPIVGMTYVGSKPRYGLPAFIDILKRVRKDGMKLTVDERPWSPVSDLSGKHTEYTEDDIIDLMFSSFDYINGGFGSDHKFPPHCTLLFLLAIPSDNQKNEIGDALQTTLNVMAQRGLHDHLQGGFFRYCVDREWTIPHFEKMLYDQALLLWVYSQAYKVFREDTYKSVGEGIIRCLKETFYQDGLFISAHDADTDHKEGETYIWSYEELKTILSPGEFREFSDVYDISKGGNFEGTNHLVRTRNKKIDGIENKLLQVRKNRPQPFADKKVNTAWNALTGIGLIAASRYLDRDDCLKMAQDCHSTILKRHWDGNILAHSSLGTNIQRQEFLDDYAAMLLFSTYLLEETGSQPKAIDELAQKTLSFKKDDRWIQSKQSDFIEVVSRDFDNPVPSSVSLAEMALLRRDILLGNSYMPVKFKRPIASDFFNLAALVSIGRFHIIRSPERIAWQDIPLNVIQARSERFEDCYMMSCREFKNGNELLSTLNKSL